MSVYNYASLNELKHDTTKKWNRGFTTFNK